MDLNFLNPLTNYSEKESIKLYLATNQEMYRKNYVFPKLGLDKYFEDIIYFGELGFKKEEDGYWEYIKNKFKDYNPNQLLLIDDTEKNVEKGKEYGFGVYLYKSFKEAKNELF